MKYKCIIFDCDGVLVDSEAISARILIDMAHDLGVDPGLSLDDAINKFSGISLKESLSFISNKLGKELPHNFEVEFRKNTFKAFEKKLKPVEGIHNLLNNISCNYCVASSGPHEKIRLNLKLAGLLDIFDGRIFSSYDINNWKPEPGIFLYAAEKMGFHPEECAVIEDSVSGVIAAKRGGFDVYGFASSYNETMLREQGARVFHKMNNLSMILEGTD